MTMTVEDLSRRSGVPAVTVRYYTRIGLLHPKRHPANGYKLFNASDLEQLRFIREAKLLGFSLSEIRELIDMAKDGSATCSIARKIVERRVVQIRDQIESLLVLQERMERALTTWQDVSDHTPMGKSLVSLIEMALLSDDDLELHDAAQASGARSECSGVS